MEYEERRPWLPVLAGVLAILLVALLVVAGLQPWDRRVSVSFVSYGGGGFEPRLVQPGTALDLGQLPQPGKTGMRFAGWCVDPQAQQYYRGEPITGDTTLYAAYVEPEDFSAQGLGVVFLGDVDKAFQITVCCEQPLNQQNLPQFVQLTTFFGGEAALSVKKVEAGLYRLGATLSAGSSYQLQLLSAQVSFHMEDPLLQERGATARARALVFGVTGDNREDLALAEDLKYLKSEDLLDVSPQAVCVAGRNPLQVGQVLRLPTQKDDNYYTVERMIFDWEAGQLGLRVPQSVPYTCYRLRPATSGEILSLLDIRMRKQVLADRLPDPEVLQQQIQQSLEGDLALGSLVDLMIAGAQETQQYQDFSARQLGAVVQALPTARSSELRLRVGVATNQPDARYFSDMPYYSADDIAFHSITVQATKEVPVTNGLGQAMVVEAGITLTFRFHIHVDLAASGTEVVAFDASVTTLTHTVAELNLQVRSPDGKKILRLTGTIEDLLDQAAQAHDGKSEFFALYRQVLGSGPVVLLDQPLTELSYTYGLLELTVPVKAQLAMELHSALRAEVELKTATVSGIRGDSEKGYYSYVYEAEPSLRLKQMALGHSGLQAGLAMEGQLRFVGLGALGQVRFQTQSGVFTDVYGYHYLDAYHKGSALTRETNGAYYARMGLYRAMESQATVLEKQRDDMVYQRQEVLTQLGNRLAVTGLVAGEPVAMGDGGLDLSRVQLSQRVLDLVSGRTSTVAGTMDGMAIGVSGPFRLEGQRVLYHGKDAEAQGYLQLVCSQSSAAFYQALTVAIPIRYQADGESVPAVQLQQVCVYRFHVLDENLQEQVATVTVPAEGIPDVTHLTTAPEGLRFAGWYDATEQVLTPVQPGVTEYYASYEKE